MLLSKLNSGDVLQQAATDCLDLPVDLGPYRTLTCVGMECEIKPGTVVYCRAHDDLIDLVDLTDLCDQTPDLFGGRNAFQVNADALTHATPIR